MLKDSGALYDIGNIYGDIGETYEHQGDSAYSEGNKNFAEHKYIEAEKNDLISLGKWQALHSNQAAWYYLDLGRVNIKLKNLNTAKKYLDSSFAIFQLFGSGPMEQLLRFMKTMHKLTAPAVIIKMLIKITSYIKSIMTAPIMKMMLKKLCRCKCSMTLIKKKPCKSNTGKKGRR